MWLKSDFRCIWCDHDMLSSYNTHYWCYHTDHICGTKGDWSSKWWNLGLSCSGCNCIKAGYANKFFFEPFQNNPEKLQPTEANIDRIRRELKTHFFAERDKKTKRFDEHEKRFLQTLRAFR